MLCPYCKSSKTKVVDKRSSDKNVSIRRRRECIKCKNRFTTYERAFLDMTIVKNNGKRESFDREKLKCGVMKACEKRPVSIRTIDRIVNEIEKDLRTIGDLVMERLKKIDTVAFVRFASYYKDFKNIQGFKKSLR
jgi:transcriptional repressor NrdR